jgi:GT2 family glycosyltransferase
VRTADLTVAVATLDRPDGLARCLEALATGTMQPAEVIVVDQGLGADVVVASFQGRLPVRCLRQERRGLAASRNLALTEALRPVLAVTDDDCVPDVHWIAALDRALRSPGPDAATGRVLPLGPEATGFYALSSRTSESPADFTGRALPWLVGTGGNFAARREWLVRAGGFDERLGAGTAGAAGEDMDILYRLLRAGARIRYEPRAVVFHERQPRERRLASRSAYGRGIGACCGLWLRGHDLHALAVLAGWLRMRGAMAAVALRRRRWNSLREELLVLGGTARGLVYGLRAGRAT